MKNIHIIISVLIITRVCVSGGFSEEDGRGVALESILTVPDESESLSGDLITTHNPGSLLTLSDFGKDEPSDEEMPSVNPPTITVEDASVEETIIRLNEPFHYAIRVLWHGKLGDFKVLSPKDPDVLGAKIENLKITNSTYPSSGRSVTEFIYTLQSEEVGFGSIGPVEIEYFYKDGEAKSALHTRLVSFEILPELKDWTKTVGIVFLIVVGVIGLVLVVLMVKGQFGRKEVPQTNEQPVSPYGELLVSSNELMDEVDSSDVRGFYGGILGNLLGFLSVFSGDSVKKMTRNELYEFLEEHDFEQVVKDTILSIYYQCEQVLYGGYEAQAFERKAIVRDLRSLIEDGEIQLKIKN